VFRLERATQVEHSRAVLLLSGMSEADALNAAVGDQAASTPCSQHGAARKGRLRRSTPCVDVRGLVQRVVGTRQKMIHEESSPETRRLYEEYVAARQELARLALAPVDSVPEHMAADKNSSLALVSGKKTLSEH